MGFLKNLVGGAVSDGIGNALSKAVEKAVAPAAQRFANKQAEAIDDATKRTDEAMKQTAAAMDNAQRDLDAAAAGRPVEVKEGEQTRPLTEEERKQAAEASAALKGFGMMFSGAIAQAKKEEEEEKAARAAAEAAIFTDWEKNLGAFPKWDVGGSDFELEEETPMNGYPAYRLCLKGRPYFVELYAAKLRADGFIARGCSNPQDLNADTYYKMIDGVCWSFNRTDACNDNHITVSFYVDTPPKPRQETKSSSTGLDGLEKDYSKRYLTKMRKHWLDNLRWVTVLLVLFYHVIYFYNNKGVFGGIGGFGEYPDCPQYQDVVMYILYPWFMPLMFLLAGMSARYALNRHSSGEWFKARTRKLLVPGTIGLFVFQWMVGYFNTAVAARSGAFEGIPGIAKYIMWSLSGIGPLWFVQLLWLLSIVLLLVRLIDSKDKLWNACGKLGLIPVILLGLLLWGASFTMITNPRPESPDGLFNLYKPVFYLVSLLLGYFVFSHDEVQDKLGNFAWPLIGAAAVSGIVLIVTTFGQDNTSPQYLQSPLTNLYGWLMTLAMIAAFRRWADRTGPFAAYMTRTSFGLYVLHYLVIASLGYMMKEYTQLPPVAMYIILTVAVFTLTPLLYEIIHRIPFIRWCVLGEKKARS